MPKRSSGNMQVPPKWAGQDKRFAESLKENLDVLAGNRGDPLDRAITARDLIDSGIAKLSAGSTFTSGSSANIIRNEVAVPNLDVPPAPTSLTVNGAFQSILLTWNMELYTGHSHFEIFRHTSDVVASATLAGTQSGLTGIYSDPVGGGSTYYYWVRGVNQNGIAGPFNSSTGTLGQTQADTSLVLSLLANQITSSELATSLSTPISLIDAGASVVGSVAHQVAQEAIARGSALQAEGTARATAITDEATARATAISAETTARVTAISAETTARVTAISAEASARAAAISASATALQNQVNDLLDIEAYDNATSYVTNDQVTYSGNLYKASQATTGNLPTNTTYWTLLGEYSSLGDLVGSNAAAITQINTVSASSTSASALAINALNATVNDATTGVTATSSAIDAVETLVNHTDTGVAASASKIGVLETTVNNATTGVAATSSALDTVETLVNHTDTGVAASATKIGLLETEVSDETTGLSATSGALDTVKTLVNHSDTGVTASADKIASLETTVNDPNTGVTATSGALDTLETAVNHSDTGLSATAGKVTALESTIDGDASATPPVVGVSTALDAVKTLVEHSDTGVTASADKITTLESTVNDPNTGITATSGALEALETAVNHSETGLSATAGKVTALESTLDGDPNATPPVVGVASGFETLKTAVNDSVTGLSAVAGKVTLLETTLNGNAGATPAVQGLSSAFQALDSAVTDSETGLSAVAGKVTNLESTVNNATTGVVATAEALDTLDTAVTDSDTGLSATASKVSALEVTLDGDPNATPAVNGLSANFNLLSNTVTDSETGLAATAGSLSGLKVIVGDANSGLVQAQNATADESEATADDITLLIASLNTANGGSSTTLNAAIVAERAVRVGAESANGLLISGITSKVTNKTQTFAQDDIPTALAIGDLWIDTNDDNKLYRAKAIGANEVSSTEWVTVRDATATTSFAQSTVPTSLTIGDIWIDTSADSAGAVKNRVYRAESVDADQITAGEWVLLDLGQALASASAISVLNTEVGIDGSGSASRIDNIESEFSNPETGTTTLAQNFTSVLSQVYPDGTGSASSLSGIVASITDKPNTFAQSSVPTSGAVGDMWIDTSSNNKLYRSASKNADQIAAGEWEAVNPETTTTFSQNTIPTSVTVGDIWIDTGLDINNDVKNHFYRAESVGANETTAGEWVILDVGNAIQTASVVTLIEADVFPNGSSSASATTQISARLDNALGEDTGVTLEEKFVANAGALAGLSGQYSVKIDANGHVAGFGLSNTVVNGVPTSAFIVRADKFAIVSDDDTSDGLGTTTPNSDSVPFSVQPYQAPDASNGNIEIQAGVYINSAFIANGSITTAQIGTATIDTANITGTLSANKIVGGEISTSLLNIDGATLTASSSGALQVNEINANKITAGSISANIMAATTVYADKLLGDVNTLVPFRSFANQSYGGAETTMIEVDLPSSSHPLGHKPFAICSGYMEPRFERVYRFRMYMKTAIATTANLGQPLVASFNVGGGGSGSSRYLQFSGDISSVVSVGQILTSYMNVKTGTVTGVTVGSNVTTLNYSGNVFSTSDTITTTTSTDYVLVGETRTKSRTATRLMFSLTGSKSAPDTGQVGMKVTVTQMDSQDFNEDTTTSNVTINEVSGMIMGVR